MDLKILAQEIAELFKKELKTNLLSVSIHGSVAQENYSDKSDIDFFLVLNKVDYPILNRINILRNKYEKAYSIDLSINIQKEEELPKHRGKYFYHKNRYALFLYESKEIDKVLIGENPYLSDYAPSRKELIREAMQIVNSFPYFIRKYITNNKAKEFILKEVIRYSIIATQYANIIINRYPLKTSESVIVFKENFQNFKYKDIPYLYLEYKKGIKKIKNRDQTITEGLEFLEELDRYLFKRIKDISL
jgi:predicted nucleotidyltransferase